jgi:protein O-mannosyl-transferase
MSSKIGNHRSGAGATAESMAPGPAAEASVGHLRTAHQAIRLPAWWVAAALAGLAVLAFAPVAANGFVDWDDDTNFVDNPYFRGLGWRQVMWAWTTFRVGVYQPLSWMLLEVEYTAWGLSPRGYHLASLALHALNTAVLYALIVALLTRAVPDLHVRDRPALHACAGLAVALFAVHPLRAEVVAWVSCQPYLPCALFMMLSVMAYLRANEPGGIHRRPWLAACFGLALAAMLSKAVAMTLPAILLILDIYPLRRLGPGRWFGFSARTAWREKAYFAVAAAVFGVVAVLAKDANRSLAIVEHGPAVSRVIAAAYSGTFYLVKTLVPIDITVFYPRPRPFPWASPRYTASVLAVLSVSAALIALRRRWPALLAAWIAYLSILLPNSGIVRFSSQIAADRYCYVAFMPLVALLAGGLFQLVRLPGRRLAAILIPITGTATAIGIMGLTALSWRQCGVWHDTMSLWSHALHHGGDRSGDVHSGIGLAFQQAGRFEDALSWYRAALRLDPGLPDAEGNLGLILTRDGKDAEALPHFLQAARLKPRSPQIQTNLASCLATLGRLDEAAEHYAEVTRLAPDQYDGWNNWGLVLAGQGRLVEATARLSKAAELEPDSYEVRTNLGTVLARRGLFPRAAVQLGRAVQIHPASAQAHAILGATLAREGKLHEAELELSEALRLEPNNTAARRERERIRNGRARK